MQKPDNQKKTENFEENLEHFEDFENQIETEFGENLDTSDAIFETPENSLNMGKLQIEFPNHVSSAFRGHSDAVTALAVHPTRKNFFLSGGMDDRLLFWDSIREEPVYELKFDDTINQICFSECGEYVGIGMMGGVFVIAQIMEQEDMGDKEKLQIEITSDTFNVRDYFFCGIRD